MILFYKNGNTLKIHNPSAETKYYQMPSVNSVLATEDDLTKVTTVSSAIKQPVILTPANNSTGFNGDITFTGFETIETFTGTLDAISIAIATDINFANVVVLQRVETTDAGSFNIAVDLSSSDLYIKVKYHSDLYSSVWSNPVKTTTPEYIINKPTIIGPTNGQTGVALFPMISGSDFTYVGVDEIHESTTYQIAKDVTFTNIAYNVTSTTDLTSHLITEDLDYETTYYIRMRYNGSKYGNSEWSNTVVINTLDIEEKIVYYPFDINSNDREFGYFTGVTISGNHIYAVGYFGVSTHYRPVIFKLDMNFNIIAVKSIYKSTDTARMDYLENIVIQDDFIYCCGYMRNSNNIITSYIAKFDKNLNLIRHLNVNPTSGTYNNRIQDLIIINNNLYVFGYNYASGSNLMSGVIYKLDLDLNLNTTKRISTSKTTALHRVVTDGEFIYCGGIAVNGSSQNFVFMKLDLNLNLITIKEIDNNIGNCNLGVSGLAIDNNYVYITGINSTTNSGIIYKLNKDLIIIKGINIIPNTLERLTFSKPSIKNNKINISGTHYLNSIGSALLINLTLDLEPIGNSIFTVINGLSERFTISDYNNMLIMTGAFSLNTTNGYYPSLFIVDDKHDNYRNPINDDDLGIRNIIISTTIINPIELVTSLTITDIPISSSMPVNTFTDYTTYFNKSEILI